MYNGYLYGNEAGHTHIDSKYTLRAIIIYGTVRLKVFFICLPVTQYNKADYINLGVKSL